MTEIIQKNESSMNLEPKETLCNMTGVPCSKLLWKENVSELLRFQILVEQSNDVDILLEEPFQGYHLRTQIQGSKINGLSVIYSDNGITIGILTFKDGMATGPCILNYESGKRYFTGQLKNGYFEGKGTEFDESGKVLFEGFYKQGKKIENIIPLQEIPGYWKEYDPINKNKLLSISQRDEFGGKQGICYYYDSVEKITKISKWENGKETSASGDFQIYDDPHKEWLAGNYEN